MPMSVRRNPRDFINPGLEMGVVGEEKTNKRDLPCFRAEI